MKRVIGLALVAMIAGACARGLLTRFPHRLHLASLECGGPGQPECLSCTSCHADETAAGHWTAPAPKNCASCHSKDTHVFARSTRPPEAPLPDGKRIVFEHERHLSQPELKGQCVKCHAGAVGLEGGAPLFPPMATCTGCHHHREQFETNVCTTCHRAADLRALEPKSFLAHDAAWPRRHGASAKANPDQCSLCHSQTSCDSCHDSSKALGPATRNPDALERTLVHRFDFLSRHALEARSQPGQCVTCHVATECDACHATRGVSGSIRDGASPHPPLWASGLGRESNTHANAARRDITSCAACHDQGPSTNCVRCHKVGALGGSPHPTGWRSPEPTTSAQCAVCHGGGAP